VKPKERSGSVLSLSRKPIFPARGLLYYTPGDPGLDNGTRKAHSVVFVNFSYVLSLVFSRAAVGISVGFLSHSPTLGIIRPVLLIESSEKQKKKNSRIWALLTGNDFGPGNGAQFVTGEKGKNQVNLTAIGPGDKRSSPGKLQKERSDTFLGDKMIHPPPPPK